MTALLMIRTSTSTGTHEVPLLESADHNAVYAGFDNMVASIRALRGAPFQLRARGSYPRATWPVDQLSGPDQEGAADLEVYISYVD